MYIPLVGGLLHILTLELLNATTYSSYEYFTAMLNGILDTIQLLRLALNMSQALGCR
jgi:hypothetical protein